MTSRLNPHSFSGLLFGLTLLPLSGILSLPSSPLSSLPPDVDVPLPLGFDFVELPVVGEVPGVAELAAGSPVVDPRPLGAPACASIIPDSSECFLCFLRDVPVVLPLLEAPVVVAVAAGPPAFELPPAVLPALCPRASVLDSAIADAAANIMSFIAPILWMSAEIQTLSRGEGSAAPEGTGAATLESGSVVWSR